MSETINQTPAVVPEGIDCACEMNKWERRPGDGGTIICCGECGFIAAITRDPGGSLAAMTDGELQESLHRVMLTLCSLCILGEGGQCHTPGCAMWLKSAPDLKLYLEPYEERTASDGA